MHHHGRQTLLLARLSLRLANRSSQAAQSKRCWISSRPGASSSAAGVDAHASGAEAAEGRPPRSAVDCWIAPEAATSRSWGSRGCITPGAVTAKLWPLCTPTNSLGCGPRLPLACLLATGSRPAAMLSGAPTSMGVPHCPGGWAVPVGPAGVACRVPVGKSARRQSGPSRPLLLARCSRLMNPLESSYSRTATARAQRAGRGD